VNIVNTTSVLGMQLLMGNLQVEGAPHSLVLPPPRFGYSLSGSIASANGVLAYNLMAEPISSGSLQPVVFARCAQ
jgi:hypothetical protein